MKIELKQRIRADRRVNSSRFFVWGAFISQDGRIYTAGESCDTSAVRIGAYPVISNRLIRFQLRESELPDQISH